MSTSKLHKTEQLLILNFNNVLRLSSVLGPRMIVHRSYQRTKPHPPPPPHSLRCNTIHTKCYIHYRYNIQISASNMSYCIQLLSQ